MQNNTLKKSETVFVGLSGGVDSSVAALRLKNQGYRVVGVFIKVWHPDFLECNWEAERLDAMRVAAHLDIPFLMCDAEDAYKNEVADYFIEEYKAGRTPNPDVLCNKAVKFGAFLEFARKHGADFVATGHYAQRKEAGGVYTLFRGNDAEKDQSYFLWTLTQEQLTYILLPVGDTPKETIRREAEKARVPVATKKDSQGICFLGHVDIPEFLSHFIDLSEGVVLNEAGESIGVHKGAFVYTKGQRHGFSITTKATAEKPHYVVDRDIEHNTITVSTKQPITQVRTRLVLHSCNFIAYQPKPGESIEVQTRYRQKPVAVTVESVTDEGLMCSFENKHDAFAAGQSCVLYKAQQCLGGGIIAS